MNKVMAEADPRLHGGNSATSWLRRGVAAAGVSALVLAGCTGAGPAGESEQNTVASAAVEVGEVAEQELMNEKLKMFVGDLSSKIQRSAIDQQGDTSVGQNAVVQHMETGETRYSVSKQAGTTLGGSYGEYMAVTEVDADGHVHNVFLAMDDRQDPEATYPVSGQQYSLNFIDMGGDVWRVVARNMEPGQEETPTLYFTTDPAVPGDTIEQPLSMELLDQLIGQAETTYENMQNGEAVALPPRVS